MTGKAVEQDAIHKAERCRTGLKGDLSCTACRTCGSQRTAWCLCQAQSIATGVGYPAGEVVSLALIGNGISPSAAPTL